MVVHIHLKPFISGVLRFDRRIQFRLKWRTRYGKAKIWGMKTSVGLTNTIFLYNCKLFALRGIDEHRLLVTEQFKFDKISEISKN